MKKSNLELLISEKKYRAGSESERSSKKFLRQLIESKKPLRILDVGCGTGLNAEKIGKLGHSVVGVDLSPTAIKKLKERGFEGYVLDVAAEPLNKVGKFDIVLASEIIEHLIDTEQFLNSIWQCLNDNGTLLISTPNSNFWVYRVFAVLGKNLSEVQHEGHIRFFSAKSIKNAIRRCGFDIKMFGGRKIFLILPETPVSFILKYLGFHKELRFRTGKYFWHLSMTGEDVSSFWTDTFVIKAKKVQIDDDKK
jgi:ubiquinone biosynthesis O-methyltransferase